MIRNTITFVSAVSLGGFIGFLIGPNPVLIGMFTIAFIILSCVAIVTLDSHLDGTREYDD